MEGQPTSEALLDLPASKMICMCVANGLRITDVYGLADCKNKASVSHNEESSDEEVEMWTSQNYYDY